MNKSDILALVNEWQNKLNSFRNITDADLDKAVKAVKAMHWFGWKEERATEIIARDLAIGVEHWYPGYLVREYEKNNKLNK